MTTSLAKQLFKLALPESNFAYDDTYRPSLLFDSKVAATLDKETFYALGLNGFQELCMIDSSFHQLYFESLFSEVAGDIERTVKSKEFNKQLDSLIDSFLLHLSPYILLRHAQKCLEWLIYRFQIHIFNADSIMKSVLPYYGTNTFVLVVQLLETQQISNKWSWLANAQIDGTPVASTDIISYCSGNIWFLEFICEFLLKSVKMFCLKQDQWQTRNVINFFTSIVLGVIHLSSKVNELFLLNIMPVIVKGIESRLFNLQASCFMITSQLLIKETFNSNALMMIIDVTAKHCLPILHKQALQMMALLYHTQKEFGNVSIKPFHHILLWDKLVEILAFLCSTSKCDRFLCHIFNCLITSSFIVPESNVIARDDKVMQEKYVLVLKNLIKTASFSDYVQKHAFKFIISMYENNIENTYEVINNTIYQLQKKYPNAFDNIISASTQTNSISDQALQNFVTISLTSKHQRIDGFNITLSSAIVHPESTVRKLAVKRMIAELTKPNCLEESKSFVVNTLLSVLSSETDSSIVAEVAQVIENFSSFFVNVEAATYEKVLQLVECKWFDSSWEKAVKHCVACLLRSSLLFKIQSQHKQLFLANKTYLLLIRLLIQSVYSSHEWHQFLYSEENLACTVLEKSSLFKSLFETSYLNGLEKSLTEQVLDFVLANPSTSSFLLELLETSIKCLPAKFYHPGMFLLFSVLLKVKEKQIFLLTVEYFSLATGYMWHSIKDVIFPDFSSDLIGKMFIDKTSNYNLDVVGSFLILMWNNVIEMAAQLFCTVDYEVLLCNTDDLQNPAVMLSNVFRMLLNFLAHPSLTNAKPFLQNALLTFLNKNFSNVDDLFLFLVIFSIQPLFLEWAGKDVCSRHTVISYQLIDSIIIYTNLRTQKSVHECPYWDPRSFVIPALLIACTSSDKCIRKGAVNVLRNLGFLQQSATTPFLLHLAKHSEEIILDQFYCSDAIMQFFDKDHCPTKAKKEKPELLPCYLTNHVIEPFLDGKHPYFSIKFYEKCLLKIDNEAEFDKILPFLDELLDNVCNQNNEVMMNYLLMIRLLLKKVLYTNCCAQRKENVLFKALNIGHEKLRNCLDFCFSPQYVVLEQFHKDFFNILNFQTQKKIIHLLISLKSTCVKEDLHDILAKIFKEISISSQIVISIFEEWNMYSYNSWKIMVQETKHPKKQKKSKLEFNPSWWKSFLVLLEILHHKKRILQPEKLIDPFFCILMDVIERKYVTKSNDFVVVLILGCLLNFYDKASLSQGLGDDEIDFQFKVELLVLCIQCTHNTQTHRHALMLLAKAAVFNPGKVLHSIMAIFTFMGSTLLRKDDTYSLQVVSLTIKTMVPLLVELQTKQHSSIKSNTDVVLDTIKVFVSSFFQMLSHRRMQIFTELLQKVGPDQYLWQLMVLLADKYVLTLPKENKDEEINIFLEGLNTSLDAPITVWTSILNSFAVELRLHCIIQIMQYLQQLITIAHLDNKLSHQSYSLIDLRERTTNQLCKLYLILLILISNSIIEVKKILKNKRSILNDKSSLCCQLLEIVLIHLGDVTKSCFMGNCKETSIDVCSKYQKLIMQYINQILKKVNSFISLHQYLEWLLDMIKFPSSNENVSILHKYVQILQMRLSKSNIKLTLAEEEALLKVAGLFLNIFRRGCKPATFDEASLRIAASGFVSITNVICMNDPSTFVSSQLIICDLICKNHLSDYLLSTLLNCLGVTVSKLKAYSITNLAKLSDCFISLLSSRQVKKSCRVLTNLLTSINKLVVSLGPFLSPYLDGFLANLSILHHNMKSSKSINHSFSKNITASLPKQSKGGLKTEMSTHQLCFNVLQSILNTVASRVWIPLLENAYNKVLSLIPQAAFSLFSAINQYIHKYDGKIFQQSSALMNFFLNAMNYRNENKQILLHEIDVVEKIVLDGMITLLIKLPEARFRPLYTMLFEWGCTNTNREQSVTFYQCMSMIVNKLKGLFAAFGSEMLPHIIQELHNFSVLLKYQGREEEEVILKLQYILNVIGQMLNYSSSLLLNQEIFENTSAVLLKLIEVKFSDPNKTEKFFCNHLLISIGYLACSNNENIHFQPLNNAILAKTKHTSPIVRCRALECLQVTVEKLGQEYHAFLPEAIPYLMELLEDECDEVEEYCQKVIKRLEGVLGEPLQKYF